MWKLRNLSTHMIGAIWLTSELLLMASAYAVLLRARYTPKLVGASSFFASASNEASFRVSEADAAPFASVSARDPFFFPDLLRLEKNLPNLPGVPDAFTVSVGEVTALSSEASDAAFVDLESSVEECEERSVGCDVGDCAPK